MGLGSRVRLQMGDAAGMIKTGRVKHGIKLLGKVRVQKLGLGSRVRLQLGDAARMVKAGRVKHGIKLLGRVRVGVVLGSASRGVDAGWGLCLGSGSRGVDAGQAGRG